MLSEGFLRGTGCTGPAIQRSDGRSVWIDKNLEITAGDGSFIWPRTFCAEIQRLRYTQAQVKATDHTITANLHLSTCGRHRKSRQKPHSVSEFCHLLHF